MITFELTLQFEEARDSLCSNVFLTNVMQYFYSTAVKEFASAKNSFHSQYQNP